MVTQAQIEQWLAQDAAARDVDPEAVRAVVSTEGGTRPAGGHYDPGPHGEPGWSYGPFQLRDPGALPMHSTGAYGAGFSFAWSRAGIDYALDGIAKVARGKTGAEAVHAIVYGFEHPADPAAEVRKAMANYGHEGSAQDVGLHWVTIPGTHVRVPTGIDPPNVHVPNPVAGAGDALGAVKRLIEFLFSYRFLELVGGLLLVLTGLYILGRRLGTGPQVALLDRVTRAG